MLYDVDSATPGRLYARELCTPAYAGTLRYPCLQLRPSTGEKYVGNECALVTLVARYIDPAVGQRQEALPPEPDPNFIQLAIRA